MTDSKRTPLCLKLSGVVVVMLALTVSSGCAIIPPVVEHAYTALSGITYLLTSKSPAEQALSLVAHKDCSFFRLLKAQPICVPKTPKSNQWLFATLADMFAKEPRDLPPAELLKQLPPAVAPNLSPYSQPLLVMSTQEPEQEPRELPVPELLKHPPPGFAQVVHGHAGAGFR